MMPQPERQQTSIPDDVQMLHTIELDKLVFRKFNQLKEHVPAIDAVLLKS